MKLRILEKKEIYNVYDECKVTIYQYLKEISEKNILNEEELKSFNELTNNIFNIRKRKNIDESFIDFFKEDGINKTANFANLMGADVGGIELNGLKVIFTNCEFGVNVSFNKPKLEDVMTYWQICEIFNVGLENPEQGKKLLTHFKLEENLDVKNIKTIKTKI